MTPERWREVEEIYQSTMDRAPELRDAHLNQSCGGDEELRREVESLLKLNSSPVLVDEPAWQAAGELLDNDPIVVTGEQLGPYRIEGMLGAGGMGQVYCARDTRLDRQVAIKISREEFGERFGREARAVAALNHPNICTLHDVGPNYLVMELVEGPTLAERIRQGPIRLDECLAIARQIANALEAAHERGIVHRDLKPGNIKIKPDGVVKVLDFGLAKWQHTEPIAGAKPEDSPTISMAGTQAGVILGTAAYMSPEQTRGKPVDKRADVWAFGVVVYEMLTGAQPFEGITVADTLAAVLTKDPEWSKVPAEMQRLLHACLEKDPQRRLRDIADIWQIFEARPFKPPGSGTLAWVLAGMAFLIAAVAFWAPWRPTPSAKPLVRLDVDLGRSVSLGGSNPGVDTIVSPDGTRLVFVSERRLFTRRLDQTKITELAGTEGAYAPFFSPDGHSIGFFAQSKLKKISAEGGAATVLCELSGNGSGAWGEDGNIVVSLGASTQLFRIPSTGGALTPITELDRTRGETTHRWPQVLPRAKAVLFTAHNSSHVGFDGASIQVVSVQDRRRKTVQPGGTYGRYLPTGHLIYVNKGTLFAVPFDLDRLEPRGTPVEILEQVSYSTQAGSAQIDFSQNGTLVYQQERAEGMATVQWLDRLGKTQPLWPKPGEYRQPALSADGRRLAMVVSDGTDQDIWVYDWEKQTNSRLTFDGGGKNNPLWTGDGQYILFGALSGISWVRSDGGSKEPESLTKSPYLHIPFSLTQDGNRLAFMQGSPGLEFDIWTVPVRSRSATLQAGTPEPFFKTEFNERAPAFSPDGRWLAYQSNQSGRDQVYVRPFPGPGGSQMISTNGGQIPLWSPNGHELFFRTENGDRIMVAGYRLQNSSFVAESPRVWCERRLANPRTGRNFYLAPDGKRIIALIPVEAPDEQTSRNHVIFLENFFDELRRRVPAGK